MPLTSHARYYVLRQRANKRRRRKDNHNTNYLTLKRPTMVMDVDIVNTKKYLGT